MRHQLFKLFMLLFLVACNTKRDSAAGTDAVYADYRISGEEETENVTCLLRFFDRNSEGDALLLEPPARVELDGAALTASSKPMSGTYYEVQKPLEAFTGTHTIVFENAEGKEYKETFDFKPFAITASIETLSRDGFALPVTGLADGKPLRVVLNDTSFTTADINEMIRVQDGAIAVSRSALRQVAFGPVTLYLFLEEERRLKNPPAGGGKISLTYSLSRELELVDD